MSLKRKLLPYAAQLITSAQTQRLRRTLTELVRKLSRRQHTLTFYFRVDDPYSYLLAQLLPELVEHFRIQLKPVTLLYMDDALYPAMDMLRDLAPLDARRLALVHGLDFPDEWAMPDPKAVMQATRLLLANEADSLGYLKLARQSADAIWMGNVERIDYLCRHHNAETSDKAEMTLQARREQFIRQGHYLSGTVSYGGEWYWSGDRLDHLATRLADMGLGGGVVPRQYGVAKCASFKQRTERYAGRTLDMFYSFRSPYSYIALERTQHFAQCYKLKLRIRPVMPMVMRGMTVPKQKTFYILKDAAREARLHDVPFGKVCDPVGTGVERCMALWPFAEKEGKTQEYFLAAGRAIWSEGADVATDKGLQKVCLAAGMDWNRARRWLDDDGWRAEAEHNREDMMALGSWGVPTFHINNHTVWGQDRFAILENILREEEK